MLGPDYPWQIHIFHKIIANSVKSVKKILVRKYIIYTFLVMDRIKPHWKYLFSLLFTLLNLGHLQQSIFSMDSASSEGNWRNSWIFIGTMMNNNNKSYRASVLSRSFILLPMELLYLLIPLPSQWSHLYISLSVNRVYCLVFVFYVFHIKIFLST